MEYAGSYALFNYRLEDPALGMESSNLRLIRAFEYGLDPTSSEAGFVLVHVDMVKNSGPLVAGTVASLAALSSDAASGRREAFNAGLRQVRDALARINGVMEGMWGRSKPRAYTHFRTFIFGITSQSMFPRGVRYEGVELEGADEEGRVSFRGESGANDSIVPLVDNLVNLRLPDTPLTDILRDFRSYRPGDHRRFLGWVAERSEALGARDFALATDSSSVADGDDKERVRESRSLWIEVLDQVRDFRWRHWCFAREYILKQTSHPTATGGSPIVTWLPNQLQAVLDEMAEVYRSVGGDAAALGSECAEIMDRATRQRDTLRKEVEKYCRERGVVGHGLSA